MLDRQKEFSGTKPVADALKFDTDALQKYMEEHVEGFSGSLVVNQFKGGQSNPTYVLEADRKKYVLRRKPPGVLLKSAHAVDREYRVISALAQTDVPVAKTYCLCTDDSVIGTWFYIMEHVEGRIFWDFESVPFEERPAIYDAMNDAIAKLHMVDHKKIGLENYGKQGSYFERQLSRWSKQYEASKDQNYPAMENLIAWLKASIPENDETTIVHGDYRLDNIIFHSTEPKILAILDWELSTLGHPMSDFAYHCMYWRFPADDTFNGLGEKDCKAENIPTEEEYVAAYCRKIGRDSIENWEYYLAFNVFRVAAIVFGILGRLRDGTASSQQAEETAELAVPLSELGWQLAQESEKKK
ncbi:MAG: phosphotransferase [Proteobacteria bacterium]|nr:phosphotransferase [Pseudomonadota bacterium]